MPPTRAAMQQRRLQPQCSPPGATAPTAAMDDAVAALSSAPRDGGGRLVATNLGPPLVPHALNSRITPSARASPSLPSPSPSHSPSPPQSPLLIPSPQIELVAVPLPSPSPAVAAAAAAEASHKTRLRAREIPNRIRVARVPVPVPIPSRRRRHLPHPFRLTRTAAIPESMPCARAICAAPSKSAEATRSDSSHVRRARIGSSSSRRFFSQAAAAAAAAGAYVKERTEAVAAAAVEFRESSARLIPNLNQLGSQQSAKYVSILLRRKLSAARLLFETSCSIIIGLLILANLPARGAAQAIPTAHLNQPLARRPDSSSEALSVRGPFDRPPRRRISSSSTSPLRHRFPPLSDPSPTAAATTTPPRRQQHNLLYYYRSAPANEAAAAAEAGALSAAALHTSISTTYTSTSTETTAAAYTSQLASASSGSVSAGSRRLARSSSRRGLAATAQRSAYAYAYEYALVGSADCSSVGASSVIQRSAVRAAGAAEAAALGAGYKRRRRSLDEYRGDLQLHTDPRSPTPTPSSDADAEYSHTTFTSVREKQLLLSQHSESNSSTGEETNSTTSAEQEEAGGDVGVLVLPNKCPPVQPADNDSSPLANDTLADNLREWTRAPPVEPLPLSSWPPLKRFQCNETMLRKHIEGLRPNLSMLSDSQYQQVLEQLTREPLCYDSVADNSTHSALDALHGASSFSPRPFSFAYPVWASIPAALLGVVLSLTTVGGNLVVLGSFVIERAIRTANNYFIFSLAASDLLIGLFSMPFYSTYLLLGEDWPLGGVVCNLWLSLDYTVCLASQYTGTPSAPSAGQFLLLNHTHFVMYCTKYHSHSDTSTDC